MAKSVNYNLRDMVNATELWTRWPIVRQVGRRLEPDAPVEWWSPWAAFLATQQRARSTDRPYLELAALGAALSDHRQQAVWRDLSTAWLRTYGPLGDLTASADADTVSSQSAMTQPVGPPKVQSLDALRAQAVQFAESVEQLAADRDDAREAGRAALERHLDGACPRLKWWSADQRWHRDWRASNLLTVFALMLFEDLAGGRHVGRCPACHRLFVAKGQDPTYCSMRCRRRVQQQRYRAQRRDDVDGA
jgi:hypothetical protein